MSRVTIKGIQIRFYFAARQTFQKQESNHEAILLFFQLSKICGHPCFHAQSNQEYEPDSAEILSIAIYENLLLDAMVFLR